MPFAKTDLTNQPNLSAHIESVLAQVAPAPDGLATGKDGDRHPPRKAEGENQVQSSGDRERAEGIIRDIGIEFNKLRRKGRSAAWADLEEKVAASGHVLVSTAMMTAKDWVGMMIDIEQFRKSEGGSEELPGDALAKWLSEPEKKTKAKSN